MIKKHLWLCLITDFDKKNGLTAVFLFFDVYRTFAFVIFLKLLVNSVYGGEKFGNGCVMVNGIYDERYVLAHTTLF